MSYAICAQGLEVLGEDSVVLLKGVSICHDKSFRQTDWSYNWVVWFGELSIISHLEQNNKRIQSYSNYG